jgi:hypothetical protein
MLNYFYIFLETEWHFARAFYRHLTCPILIPYMTVVNCFAKHCVIAFLVISKLIVGFVPHGPRFCSRSLHWPRVEVENFVTFTFNYCVF